MAVIRLSKAVREFNVGMSTIVEFLHKKGFDIEATPNTKLSGEMYDLLNIEYKGEKYVKEKALSKDVNSSKRETITIDDVIQKEEKTDFYEEEEDIFIRGVNVEIDQDFKKAIAPKVQKKEKKTEKETEKVEVKEKSEEPKEEVTTSPVEEIKETEIKEKEEKREEPVVAETKEETAQEPKVSAEPPVEEKAEAQPQPEEAAKEPGKEAEPEQTSPPEAETQQEEEKEEEKTHPRVLGKIDLSQINERTKPPKKTAKEKREEREKKKKAEQDVKAARGKKARETKTTQEKIAAEKKEKAEAAQKETEKAKPEPTPAAEPPKEEKPDNFIKTEVEKLQGPSIVGKIELPVEKKPGKKKPVASSTDDKLKPKKKKRKRIKKEISPEDRKKAAEGTKTEDKKPRHHKGKRGRKGFEKPELSQEEIQKQIKETMARLSGSGKSKSAKYRRQKRDLVSKQKEEQTRVDEKKKQVLTATEFVTAGELASMMNISVTEVISTCLQLGLMVSINQRLDAETITLVADEFGFTVEFASVESAIDDGEEDVDKPEDLVPRPPIVTVMGHVDHGKTKLLDYIRKANVIAGEAGGITQHIGAYEVTLNNGKKITFLDTPGHEAFTAMRARGAKVTDIAIIVIAADDNVMPQTKEAISHALAANVPIVFAINKIDKPTANPDKIRDQLSQMNILVEEWGGKYQSQEISAKSGINIEELLDKVLLEAEMLDLKANPKRKALGTIIESSLDKGRGYVAKLLVQNGTLKNGDVVLAGSHYGKVRAMYNERNQLIKKAGPSSPVLMLGMHGAPQAGDLFKVMSDEREAKNIATKRMQLQREQGIRTQRHITLDEIGRRIAIGDFKELNIIVKGDVDGSVEALSDSLLKLSTEEIQINIIHKSVGQVTESDVMLASASDAIIVAFQVHPSVGARKLAEKEQITIKTYSIIYAAIEEIKSAIEGMLSPDIDEKIIANLEVRDVFKISKVGTIAGCMVLDGTINRNSNVRLIRDGIVIYTGKLGSLKRFKDDVKEVSTGYECGLNIENFNDIKVGDIIEAFQQVEIARKLD